MIDLGRKKQEKKNKNNHSLVGSMKVKCETVH